MTDLSLQFGLRFEDLQDPKGLGKLTTFFEEFLEEQNSDVYALFKNAQKNHQVLSATDMSDLCLKVAPYLEDFLASFFGITQEVHALQKSHDDLAPLMTCKRKFIQRQIARKYTAEEAATLDSQKIKRGLEALLEQPFDDLVFANKVLGWLESPEENEEALEVATLYSAWALLTLDGQKQHEGSPLFSLPHKLDFDNLVPGLEGEGDHLKMIAVHQRSRDGFELTDPGFSRKQAQDQAAYCLYCHDREKDSCSKGMHAKDSQGFEKNQHGRSLEGCPLEQKISEMNLLKSQGLCLGALAVVTIDNPLVAATGHRICNDCMAACIFQKQEPVNIPGVETQILKEVLSLSWGVEIYSLLARWNPLRFQTPVLKEATGGRALVVGLGPAGFSLAYYLLQQGHTVVGIDGAKIEPIGLDLSRPIQRTEDVWESLSDRVVAGFGGVAEYGITVRWDKNFLKVVRLLLERYKTFSIQGGVRFGSTITPDQAFGDLGFDHVALCAGAGQPVVVPMKNALAKGVRQASDFLMALQLTGAAKKESLANLEVRLPAVVIGGGLTAIDTATEVRAYYPVQVEKFLTRYEKLCDHFGQEIVEQGWSAEEEALARTWIDHAKILRADRLGAQAEGRSVNFQKHLDEWGGVTVAYRRTLQKAPSYRLNHEEVFKAMQEGIRFAGEVTPLEVQLDAFGHASSLKVKGGGGVEKELPAHSIFVAAGTKPNITLSKEYPGLFELEGRYYKGAGENPEFLISPEGSPQSFSYFGDLHPTYHGNVVKAIASAKKGYKAVERCLKKRSVKDFNQKISDLLTARVHEIKRLTDTTIEVVVHAPLAARHFQPGQFYRLQNFDSNAPLVKGTSFAMEGLALTGAWVDKEQGLVSLIVLEMGGSSDLCVLLKKGEEVVLMGPTGEPTEIPSGETVCLLGGGLGNAVLLSIGQALKQAGSKVIYFAGYRTNESRFYPERVEEAADHVVWLCDEKPFATSRPGDESLSGNMLQGLERWRENGFKNLPSIDQVDRFISIGSDRMMAAVQSYLQKEKKSLKEEVKLIASINAPMQCMMKEICAQCLQRHVDPETGEEFYTYSCASQDQNMASVDFSHLSSRLSQNSLQEKLTALWIKYILSHEKDPHKLLA